MPDPAAQTASQLRNIEADTGLTVDDFVQRVGHAGLEKHGQIVAFLKSDVGLTHGNANLIAHLVRQARDGGPPSPDDLLAAQYRGGKAALRPILDRLTEIATGLGGDVERVVLKTGVSFRRRKQFALVEAKSAQRVQLGLNLDDDPGDPRVVPMSGMCTHRIDIGGVGDVDEFVTGLIRAAYVRAG